MASFPPIRAVLLDLSGTLHVGSTAIPGAAEAIRKLQQQQLPIRVLTNTSTTSASGLHAQLRAMGFDFKPDQIYTSVLAVKAYLLKHKLRPFCLLEDTSDFNNDNNKIPLDPPHNCVVIGLAPSKFNYDTLDQAYQILQQQDSKKLVAMHRSPFVKTEAGTKSLGPGAFVAALEAAVPGLEATILGKPSIDFYKTVLWDYDDDTNNNNIHPIHVCMVGDDVVGDIQGAQKAGIGTTLLVQTGKYAPGDELKANSTRVLPSIVEAVDYILEHAAVAPPPPSSTT